MSVLAVLSVKKTRQGNKKFNNTRGFYIPTNMWYIIFTLTQQICRLSLLDFTDHLGMTLGLLRQFSMVVASFRAQSMED